MGCLASFPCAQMMNFGIKNRLKHSAKKTQSPNARWYKWKTHSRWKKKDNTKFCLYEFFKSLIIINFLWILLKFNFFCVKFKQNAKWTTKYKVSKRNSCKFSLTLKMINKDKSAFKFSFDFVRFLRAKFTLSLNFCFFKGKFYISFAFFWG